MCACLHVPCAGMGVGRQWLEIFYGKTSRNLPGLQQEIKIPIFPSKWSLANPYQLWFLCFHLQTQLSLKDLGLLMLLRLASAAFKNVSFSLDETGKRGSQVWMRVSLLGTELGWAVSQPMTRKKLKGKNCFVEASHISCGLWNQKRNELWNMTVIHSFHSRLIQMYGL